MTTTKTSKQIIGQDLNSRIRCKKKHNLQPTIYDAIPLPRAPSQKRLEFFVCPSGFQTQARHSLALPVATEGDRHSNSSRLVVTLSLPLHGARHRSGGQAPCGQAAAGPPRPTESDYRQPPDYSCPGPAVPALSGSGSELPSLTVTVATMISNPGQALRHSKYLRVR